MMARESAALEKIIREGKAGFLRDGKAITGSLLLTNQRLLFVSRPYATQKGETLVNLWDMRTVLPCWSKFLGLIPLLPNSLHVCTDSGEDYGFTLIDRSGWTNAISRQAEMARASGFPRKRIVISR